MGEGLRDLDFPWNSRRGAEETGRLILAAVSLIACFTLLTCVGGMEGQCDQFEKGFVCTLELNT